jgi:hypothetical protein
MSIPSKSAKTFRCSQALSVFHRTNNFCHQPDHLSLVAFHIVDCYVCLNFCWRNGMGCIDVCCYVPLWFNKATRCPSQTGQLTVTMHTNFVLPFELILAIWIDVNWKKNTRLCSLRPYMTVEKDLFNVKTFSGFIDPCVFLTVKPYSNAAVLTQQMVACHVTRRLSDWCLMTEMVFETLVQYGHLTWLIAREDYIKFSRRESSKTYMTRRPLM